MSRDAYTRLVDGALDRKADPGDWTPPAHTLEHDGRRFFVVPSSDLMVGCATTDQGARVTLLIQLNAGFGTGLVQSLRTDDLRAFGMRLVQMADAQEAEAETAAADALARARAKGRS